MKITREAVRDGVLVAGLVLTAAGSWDLWGPGVAMLVIGAVLLISALGSAAVTGARGKPEP